MRTAGSAVSVGAHSAPYSATLSRKRERVNQMAASDRYQFFNAASAAGFIGSASKPVGVSLTL